MEESSEIIRALFERHADDVYRFARYSLASDADAQDIVQEVYLRAFRHWSEFKGESDPKTWLLRIARNYIYDEWRKKRRRRHLAMRSEANSTLSPARLDSIVELEEALLSLSLSHRQVLHLRWIQGLSVAETSSILEWSQAKTSLTFHRAKQKLRGLLQETPQDVRMWQSNGGEAKHGR